MLTQPIDLFRTLGDETRLRCLALLAAHGELCVCELTQVLGVSQPKISRHLATLRETGLVHDRRIGLWVYYRLQPALPRWIKYILDETIKSSRELEPYRQDRTALKTLPTQRGANGARQKGCA